MKLSSVLNTAHAVLLTGVGFIGSVETTHPLKADEVPGNQPVVVKNTTSDDYLTDKQFNDLIKTLGSEVFVVRDKASKILKEHLANCPTDKLEPFIKKLQKASSDLEVRRRIELSMHSSTFENHLKNINDEDEKLQYVSILVRERVFSPRDHKEILLGNVDKLSKETIIILAKHGDEEIQGRLGSDVKIYPEVFPILFQSQSYFIKSVLSRNPNNSGDILTSLSNEQEPYIRMGVALNPNTPVAVLINLSRDSNLIVRRNVAINPNTPIAILTNLTQDEEIFVSEQAKASLRKRTP